MADPTIESGMQSPAQSIYEQHIYKLPAFGRKFPCRQGALTVRAMPPQVTSFRCGHRREDCNQEFDRVVGTRNAPRRSRKRDMLLAAQALGNRAECISAKVPFRPLANHAQHRDLQVQTALVVGPSGEEIHRDERSWSRQGQSPPAPKP